MSINIVGRFFRVLIYFRRSLKAQWLTPEKLKKLQSKKLRKIVKHAYKNIPLYKEKLDEAGINICDIKSIDDLGLLPIVTGDDLRRSQKEVLAKNIKKYTALSTSGSCGSPKKIFIDDCCMDKHLGYIASVIFKRWSWFGCGIRSLMPMAAESGSAAQAFFSISDIPKLLKNFISLYPTDGLMSPLDLVEELNKNKPDLLITYPNLLLNIALAVQQDEIIIHQPKLLIVGGEVLSNYAQKVIAEVFTGELINSYNSTETLITAVECSKHEGLHILDSVIIEILKDGKSVPKGEAGEVVVTSLNNYATPIIRYSGLGDVAILSEKQCSCGMGLPLLRRIEGRCDSSIILPNGKRVLSFGIIRFLGHIPNKVKFQIIQEKLNRIKILIVEKKTNGYSLFNEGGKHWVTITQEFKKLLGEDMEIIINVVDDIPRAPGAIKYTELKSLV